MANEFKDIKERIKSENEAAEKEANGYRKRLDEYKAKLPAAEEKLDKAANGDSLKAFQTASQEHREIEDAIIFYEGKLDALDQNIHDVDSYMKEIKAIQKRIDNEAQAAAINLLVEAYEIADNARKTIMEGNEIIGVLNGKGPDLFSPDFYRFDSIKGIINHTRGFANYDRTQRTD